MSCLNWVGAHPFPVARIGTEHLGQVFDAFGNARDEDIQILLEHRPLPQCSVASPENIVQDNTLLDSSTEILDPTQGDDLDTELVLETKDEGIKNSDNEGSTVLLHTTTTTASDIRSKISSHNVAPEPEVSDVKESVLHRVSQDDAQPKSNNFQFSSYNSHVQNVYYNHSVRLNNTIVITPS